MSRWSAIVFVLMGCAALAQNADVSGQVVIQRGGKALRNGASAVVWLTPARGETPRPPTDKLYRLTQKNKHFEPHLLVVPVNSAVLFPNNDPFFHNVFSVYEGTRFDLGLYESGTAREVRFTRPGPSYIFCNIHPEMSAVILVMTTPYYATTNAEGDYVIENVPPGEYQLSLWYESAQPEQLKQLQRRVTVNQPQTRLEAVTIQAAPSLAVNHKNKYGQDYETKIPYSYP
jgi:plastocyanin